MTELPEVETKKNDLKKFVVNKKIKNVNIKLPRLIKSDINKFSPTLKNNSFKNIERVGKLLIFELGKKAWTLSTNPPKNDRSTNIPVKK